MTHITHLLPHCFIFYNKIDTWKNLLSLQLGKVVKFSRPSGGMVLWVRFHSDFPLQKSGIKVNLKTTLTYQTNFIHKDADDALYSVINF